MTETPAPRTVLVSAGSKYGATAEIAERIGRIMGEEGCDVTVSAPSAVDDPVGYDAVVLGSAVYAGHWVAEAKDLAKRIAGLDERPQVFLFSSGPIGDPPKPEEEPVDVTSIMEETAALEHHVFAGKIDRSNLNFAEKAIMVAVRAPEGDFRNWDAIDAWARRVAGRLTAAPSAR